MPKTFYTPSFVVENNKESGSDATPVLVQPKFEKRFSNAKKSIIIASEYTEDAIELAASDLIVLKLPERHNSNRRSRHRSS